MATSASECPTAGKIITCRAAVAWHSKRSLKVEEIDVAPPRAGEVRVKILYTGVCQTDAHSLRGEDDDAQFPCILGHEGAGVVESVGEGVTSVKPGDHVIPLYIPQCKKCKGCCSDQTNLCEALESTQSKGVMPDGTTRFSHKGKDIHFYMGTSTFSEYTVLPEMSVAKIDEKAPLDKVCLIGCGIPTGYGAAINTAKVTKGSTCAVWGLGCVGLATIMGCKAAGATRIIGIDPHPSKHELAKQLGATECMSPDDYTGKKDKKPLQEVLQDMTDGGLDFTFECVGDVKAMKQAMEACRKGWGVCTIIGVAPSDKEVSVKPGNLISGRVWKGSAFGGYKSRDQVPNLVEMYMNQRLKVDEFITHHFKLEDINSAFKALDDGEAIRSIIQMSPQVPTRSA